MIDDEDDNQTINNQTREKVKDNSRKTFTFISPKNEGSHLLSSVAPAFAFAFVFAFALAFSFAFVFVLVFLFVFAFVFLFVFIFVFVDMFQLWGEGSIFQTRSISI